MPRTCSLNGCSAVVAARGLCNAHYKRVQRTGNPRLEVPVGAGRLALSLPEPPVCVCLAPAPDAIGECQLCARPFKPHHAGLQRQRWAWTKHLLSLRAEL